MDKRSKELKMIKELIDELNNAMYDKEISFNCVRKLLAQISKLTGKKYGILNKRVTVFVDGVEHDAWVNA
jgi:hypothetical protein